MKMKLILPILFAVAVMGAVYMMADADDSEAAVVDPSTGTQVGDLYYTFSGTDATVVGISSTLSSATSITIPDTVTNGGTIYNVTAVEQSVFQNMTSLSSVTLPSGLTSIGNSAFNGCTNLALTSLPDGITSIGTQAFRDCTSLALTSLPDGVTSIGSRVFQSCTSLALTSLPDGVTSISNNAFSGCTSLALTSLPDGVTSVGSNAFQNCTNLALTSLPDGITSIGTIVFLQCTALALTSLPDSLTSIGSSSFSGCTNMNSLIILGTFTSLDANAFRGSSISQILDFGGNNLSAGQNGLSEDCVVRSNIEDVSMIQQVEYEEHTTEVVDKEGTEYTLMGLLPVLVVLGLVMAGLFALIRFRTEN